MQFHAKTCTRHRILSSTNLSFARNCSKDPNYIKDCFRAAIRKRKHVLEIHPLREAARCHRCISMTPLIERFPATQARVLAVDPFPPSLPGRPPLPCTRSPLPEEINNPHIYEAPSKATKGNDALFNRSDVASFDASRRGAT